MSPSSEPELYLWSGFMVGLGKVHSDMHFLDKGALYWGVEGGGCVCVRSCLRARSCVCVCVCSWSSAWNHRPPHRHSKVVNELYYFPPHQPHLHTYSPRLTNGLLYCYWSGQSVLALLCGKLTTYVTWWGEQMSKQLMTWCDAHMLPNLLFEHSSYTKIAYSCMCRAIQCTTVWNTAMSVVQ